MEIVTVELRNKGALKLLEELEELDIIKLHKATEKKVQKIKHQNTGALFQQRLLTLF